MLSVIQLQLTFISRCIIPYTCHPDSLATSWAYHTLSAFNIPMPFFLCYSAGLFLPSKYIKILSYFKVWFKCHHKKISDPPFSLVFHSQITIQCSVFLTSRGRKDVHQSCPSHSSWKLSALRVPHSKHFKMYLAIDIGLLVSDWLQCLRSKQVTEDKLLYTSGQMLH
jgi:hypothetical protein